MLLFFIYCNALTFVEKCFFLNYFTYLENGKNILILHNGYKLNMNKNFLLLSKLN